MRRPEITAWNLFPDEIVADNFAGGGGASTGIEDAIGRPVDIAINHSPQAIAMHRANHPHTRHFCENIWEVDPREACGSRPVGMAWFSPDCTHFSRAKGTTPVKKSIRGLAWVVTRWAQAVKPRVIILENVEEFATWGPVVDGRPDPSRRGETFRSWLARLSDLGYTVEFQSLVAADYGAPTTRRRLFLVARRDGAAIRWPDATHGDGKAEPWRAAAEVIDWSLPCPSIFFRKRPLAEATLRRIAKGIQRYVIESGSPFLIPLTHRGDSRTYDPRDPMRTVTGAHRGEFAVVDAFIASHYGQSVGRSRHDPLPTVTAGGGGHQGIVEPLLMKYHGGRDEWRGQTCDEPLRTIDTSNRFAVLAPFVVRHGHYSTRTGAGLREGCGAGTFRGQRLENPLATVCATNDKHLVCPVIIKHYKGVVGHRVDRALGTVTAVDHHSIAAAFLTKFYGSSGAGADVRSPMPTVTAGGGKGGGHLAEVRALLQQYGGGSRPCLEIDGVRYVIADIGMRMLQPAELFAAQGFPSDYEIAPEFNGKPLTKTAQTALAGNSVCPPVARAIVAENIGGLAA
jgi:DNA (cytosine-5)-methyltransferase 1